MVVEHFGLASDAPYAFEGSIEAPTFRPERSEKMNPTLDPSLIFSIGEGGFGAPKGRYCANLGHKVDDESNLVYMRARYYDPTSGRFISEDQNMQGANWFLYCSNQPVGAVDETGQNAISRSGSIWSLLEDSSVIYFLAAAAIKDDIVAANIAVAIVTFLISADPNSVGGTTMFAGAIIIIRMDENTIKTIAQIVIGAQIGDKTAASLAVDLTAGYALLCEAFLLNIDNPVQVQNGS